MGSGIWTQTGLTPKLLELKVCAHEVACKLLSQLREKPETIKPNQDTSLLSLGVERKHFHKSKSNRLLFNCGPLVYFFEQQANKKTQNPGFLCCRCTTVLKKVITTESCFSTLSRHLVNLVSLPFTSLNTSALIGRAQSFEAQLPCLLGKPPFLSCPVSTSVLLCLFTLSLYSVSRLSQRHCHTFRASAPPRYCSRLFPLFQSILGFWCWALLSSLPSAFSLFPQAALWLTRHLLRVWHFAKCFILIASFNCDYL